jgi:GT2 family glycosyltransferase
MKTLAVILHYNTPEMTERLYKQLYPYQSNDYDLVVLDNGSPKGGESRYNTYRCEENVYFGGGLNLAFQLILDNPQYDSLLFLNSDLIVHGYRWVKTLRNVMFHGGYKIVSPAIIQPEWDQCYWTQMHCWNATTVRSVPWVDFQSPLFHRDFIEKIGQFDEDLIFGWGNDVYSGIICRDNDWKIGVVDYCPVIHLSNETVKKNMDNDIIRHYNQYAERGMRSFFTKIDNMKEFNEMRDLAKNYKYNGITGN